jgi:hypothetical protein
MDPQLRKQLKQIITYVSSASINEAGQELMGSTATYWCRLENNVREIPVGSGVVEARTEHFIIMDGEWPLSYSKTRSAQFLIPGEDKYRRPKIVTFAVDEYGNRDHVEMWL